MAKIGVVPIYQKPRTTIPHPEHRTYRYLLKGMVIDRPNQVWCADITYVPMRRGFLYLGSVQIHRELITAAARLIMALKLSSVLSARIAMRLNTFSLQKKFSI